MRIVGEIPAREGSKRVPRKNLRPLNGRPMITYAIDAAKAAARLDEIYVNSESEAIGRLATDAGVKFYRRPDALSGDTITQQEFNYDFIKAVRPDVLVLVNPVSPLIVGEDIDRMVDRFLEGQLETLIAVREEQTHACVEGRPVNFTMQEPLARTQDVMPVQLCAWSVCVWNADAFIRQYETQGHATFVGRVGWYPLDHFRALKVSTEDDFRFAEMLLKHRDEWQRAASLQTS